MGSGPIVFDDETRLLQYVAKAGEGRPIAIEGFPGSGKSTLASKLSVKPPRCVLRIDSFAMQRTKNEAYEDLIVRSRLSAAISHVPPNSIVEGVLLREFVDLKLLREAMTIYVKRISAQSRIWPEDPAIRVRRDHWLHGPVWDYHSRFKPHQSADIIFERLE